MKIYLASRYSRSPELRERAADLQDLGHEIANRWILGEHPVNDASWPVSQDPKTTRVSVSVSADLLDGADCVISFTEVPADTAPSRTYEPYIDYPATLALCLGRRCLVVGPRLCVFHALPQVEGYRTWADAWAALRREWQRAINAAEVRP